MTDNHGHCQNCTFDFNGERIWDYYYNRFQTSGYWKDEEGKCSTTLRILNAEEAASVADTVALDFGATRTHGRFGLSVIVDGVSRCPNCDPFLIKFREDKG